LSLITSKRQPRGFGLVRLDSSEKKISLRPGATPATEIRNAWFAKRNLAAGIASPTIFGGMIALATLAASEYPRSSPGPQNCTREAMRRVLLSLLFVCSSALANAPGYDLSLGAEVRGGMLNVAPVITAPAGAKLHYDMTTIRMDRSATTTRARAAASPSAKTARPRFRR
jgi:hypothetical protein